MTLRLLVLSGCLLLAAGVRAQRMTAAQLSNFAGINGLYLNPSSIADSRWGTHINLTTVSMQANAQPRLPASIVPFAEAGLKLRGQEMALKAIDLRGPGLMVQLRGSQAFAITTRYRADVNLAGNYDLINWFRGDKTPLPNTTRSEQINADAFGEIAVSYAMPVLNWQQHFVKAGGTVKYLRGLHSSSLSVDGQFGAPAGQLSYSIDRLQTTYSDLTTLSDLTFGDALAGQVPGNGTGFDLGFTYEFRPQADSYRYTMDGKTLSDVTVNKYRVRLGVSLLDIGTIRYQNASNWSVPARTGTLQQSAVQPPARPWQIRDAIAQSLGIVPEGSVGDLNVALPRTLSVQADVALTNGWFVGAAWWKPSQPLASAQHRSALLSFGPRYESKDTELSLTGNYWQTLGKFSVGAHLRAGIFTVGTDNIVGFFSDNGLTAHVFAGITLPFGAKRPRDTDGDYVSNKVDRCPDVAGVWAFRGCPDTDADGIEDKNDNCPQDAGPTATNGCPDADNDGIFDKNDACPNQSGSTRFSGCPDTDADNIPDKDDECPTVAGMPALGGCPDADADGLRDSQDACPNEAGLKELDGCALKAIATPAVATSAVPALSATETALLEQLNRSFLRGPMADETALAGLKTYLESTPGRLLSFEFSGSNQEQLVRVATLFKDELATYFGNTDRFRFTVVPKAGQAAGIRVSVQ
ncbi:DUF5723 family protein [Spirosoma montaniterrae]|uniref:DUF5723 domain-containing protein n=1 Tax=Spirosoma montaniterrae TaxID=1178516 RepID=A0A1P9WXX9_9BACT|nr:DUF5723 family protein [Spirosoma montaniterrae]AQG80213.1 hypothetical protein AWR27_13335 [Spirosoma montaniterrae]